MKASELNINLPLSFNQVIELVRQMPYLEKLRLVEMLKKETRQMPDTDKVVTHLASEKILANDWLLPEEDEAWKDL